MKIGLGIRRNKHHWALKTVFLMLFFAVSGCTLDRSGLGVDLDWSVEPALFCPGDQVTVSWNLADLPRSLDTCESCSSSDMCMVGQYCLDGTCCPESLPGSQCRTSEGCLADFSLTITMSPDDMVLVDNEQAEVVGERVLSPTETVTFDVSGGYHPPLRAFLTDTKTATLVTAVPETNVMLSFPFTCAGSGPGWANYDIDSLGPTSSEFVRIVGVRNTSGRRLELSGGDPLRGPVTIMPGEVVTDLNGKFGGRWSAAMPVLDRSILPPPVCEPTNIRNPWPDLQVELILECHAG
ncbi:hypothetical protein [Aestuariispira ectoiniformans]|uniref:hypothetical protein n=1 Tax=Aestuariispira ectoiniformans TaxID=2775080 RepID=UPI00223B01F1|nr:hypothetical protein [Aestuariispira ectoiniformans]